MIKSQLIAKIANKFTDVPEKDVALAINAIMEKMSNALCDRERIEIRGFGSFTLHYRPPRRAHNPKTGEKVVTEPKYIPHFKPGKELRDRVNESKQNGVPLQEGHDDLDSDD